MNTHMGITSPLTLHSLFLSCSCNCTAPSYMHFAPVFPAPSFGITHKNAVLPVSSEYVLHSGIFSPVNPDIPFSTIFLCILKAPSSLENKSTVCYSQVPENP